MYKTTEISNILRADVSATNKTLIVVVNDACELLDTDKHTFLDKVEIEGEEDLREFFMDYGYNLNDEDDIALIDKVSSLKVGESVTDIMTHPFNDGSSTITFICVANGEEPVVA